jgi:hypothetical protein
MKAHWKVFFWSVIAGGAHQQRNTSRNPTIQVFHSWMCKRILGRMRETKASDTELSWLYSALIARQPIDPSQLMARGAFCNAGGCVYWWKWNTFCNIKDAMYWWNFNPFCNIWDVVEFESC